jgi:hypothetical protein
VLDKVWEEAARHYSEQELGALAIATRLVNLWNRPKPVDIVLFRRRCLALQSLLALLSL